MTILQISLLYYRQAFLTFKVKYQQITLPNSPVYNYKIRYHAMKTTHTRYITDISCYNLQINEAATILIKLKIKARRTNAPKKIVLILFRKIEKEKENKQTTNMPTQHTLIKSMFVITVLVMIMSHCYEEKHVSLLLFASFSSTTAILNPPCIISVLVIDNQDTESTTQLL